MSAPSQPEAATRFTIALCTYNGADFLDAQLASYAAQSETNWDLWASDDGSIDATKEILEKWAGRWQGEHAVTIIGGPKCGGATNFISLLCHPDLPVDTFVALSDQDDIWHKHKLQRARTRLNGEPVSKAPILYSAQSLHVDQFGRTIGNSQVPKRSPSFTNALTQNIVSGHSAILNPAALALIRQTGIPQAIPYHDWWIYQLISGGDGVVIVDEQQVLSYRQHRGNAIGARQGISAKLQRLKQTFDGTYGGWIKANLRALEVAGDVLSAPHRKLIADLNADLPKAGPQRAGRFMKAKLHRQGKADTFVFYLAAILGRL